MTWAPLLGERRRRARACDRPAAAAPEALGAVLERVYRAVGLAERLRDWEAVRRWPEVAGSRLAQAARAVTISETGTLVVEVDGSAWAQEVTYEKHRLRFELNRLLGAERVKEIRAVVGGY